MKRRGGEKEKGGRHMEGQRGKKKGAVWEKQGDTMYKEYICVCASMDYALNCCRQKGDEIG